MIESTKLDRVEATLCRESDDFLDEKTIWIANLSNDETIYQDDERVGRQPHSAWLRLKAYLKESDLKIKSFAFKFRSHHVQLPRPQDGCYFTKAILGQQDNATDLHFFVYGNYIRGKNIDCVWYRIPEIIVFNTRNKKEEDVVQDGLIKW